MLYFAGGILLPVTALRMGSEIQNDRVSVKTRVPACRAELGNPQQCPASPAPDERTGGAAGTSHLNPRFEGSTRAPARDLFSVSITENNRRVGLYLYVQQSYSKGMNNAARLVLSTSTKLIPVSSYADAARKGVDGSVYRVCECGCGGLAGKPVKKVRAGKVSR